MTHELIVHHYPLSPFAEKLRTGLGHKKLPWRSVIIPNISPKPDVVALTGGYRRTPILQIGADIFCDTALAFDVLEHLAPTPAFYPAGDKGLARTVAQWADSTLFWASMAYNLGPEGAAIAFANAPPEAARAFGEDRKAMSAGMVRLRPGDGLSAYRSYLRRLSDMLDGQDFLLGSAPCVADFSCYHPLWFTRTRVPPLARIFEQVPQVGAWLDRMQAIGHGTMTKTTSQEAIEVAANAEPLPLDSSLLKDNVFQDDHGIPLGSPVSIAAESFGPETTEGELVAATRMHYTLARDDARAGRVHVHFPRIGYVLKKVQA